MEKCTVVDVACRAGVSIATVPRTLNNNYPLSDETRRRMEEAVQALRYEVNRTAQNLKSNSSYSLGLVVPEISISMTIAKGLVDVAGREGCVLVCASSDESPRKEDLILKNLQQYSVDGMVLITCRNEHETSSCSLHIPCVQIDGTVDGIRSDMITYHEQGSMRRLTEYVIACGHRRIEVVNGDRHKRTGRLRSCGFCEALENAGIPLLPEWTLDVGFNRDTAASAVKALFTSPGEKPTAIVCASNAMAEGTLLQLHQLGLRVPEDVSVASCNQVTNGDVLGMEITHLADNARHLGETTGQMLMEHILALRSAKDRPFRHLSLDKELVIGQSVHRLEG